MTTKRLWLALICLALAALPALAKSNFTGDWKLNVAKSTFGEMPAPTSMTVKATHEDPKLKVATKQSSDRGDFDFEANYTTDGKETTNEMFGGNPMKSVAKWDGDALTIDSKGKFGRQRLFHGGQVDALGRRQDAHDGPHLQERHGRRRAETGLRQAITAASLRRREPGALRHI